MPVSTYFQSTIDPTTGILYWFDGNNIVTINKTTGVSTIIGGQLGLVGIACAIDGTLYGAMASIPISIWTIDKTNASLISQVYADSGPSFQTGPIAFLDERLYYLSGAAPSDGKLYLIDLINNTQTLIGSANLPSTPEPNAYSMFGHIDGFLYANTEGDGYWQMDPATASTVSIDSNPNVWWSCCGYTPPNVEELYATDSVSNLYKVDPTNGRREFIGAIGFDYVVGMAFNPNDSLLYGICGSSSSSSGLLITINTTTGVGSPIAATRISFPLGICFGPFPPEASNKCYISEAGIGLIHEAVVGTWNFSFLSATSVTGMASYFDGFSMQYWASGSNNDTLYNGGNIAFLNTVGAFNIGGSNGMFDMTYHKGVLYGVSHSSTGFGQLCSINTGTGAATIISIANFPNMYDSKNWLALASNTP